ncbi:MAG: hypothetical protein ACJAYU_003182 [Bradymonadia bacterium]|jgi:hypothetical protein
MGEEFAEEPDDRVYADAEACALWAEWLDAHGEAMSQRPGAPIDDDTVRRVTTLFAA